MTTAENYAQKVKAILLEMTSNDELPMDLNELDTTEIAKIFKPLVDSLNTIKADANMALDGRWDKSDGGFEDQIYVIDDLD
jgi:hypothetical protein